MQEEEEEEEKACHLNSTTTIGCNTILDVLTCHCAFNKYKFQTLNCKLRFFLQDVMETLLKLATLVPNRRLVV